MTTPNDQSDHPRKRLWETAKRVAEICESTQSFPTMRDAIFSALLETDTELRTQLAAAQRERDQLTARLMRADMLTAEVEKSEALLTTQVAELQRDRERLDWLESSHSIRITKPDDCPPWIGAISASGEKIREVIDAAMRAKGEA